MRCIGKKRERTKVITWRGATYHSNVWGCTGLACVGSDCSASPSVHSGKYNPLSLSHCRNIRRCHLRIITAGVGLWKRWKEFTLNEGIIPGDELTKSATNGIGYYIRSIAHSWFPDIRPCRQMEVNRSGQCMSSLQSVHLMLWEGTIWHWMRLVEGQQWWWWSAETISRPDNNGITDVDRIICIVWMDSFIVWMDSFRGTVGDIKAKPL